LQAGSNKVSQQNCVTW